MFTLRGRRVTSTRVSRAYVELQAAAREEIGDTAIDRLRWLLARVEGEDVRALSKDERAAFDYGLRALVEVPGLAWWSSPAPLPLSVLARLQRDIRRGLRVLMTPRDPHARLLGRHAWRLPPLRPRLQRNAAGWSPAWRIEYQTDDARTAILHGVAALIMSAGDRLRTCPECEKVFVKAGRRIYCSSDPGCSQNARISRR